jgi:glycosyltransferase involved in cell wall biosynthesis
VVVSSHSRATLLDGLIDALEAQHNQDFEVIVADNGSADDTWAVLSARCARTPLRLRALRLALHDGPGTPRNTCIAEARGKLIAFTDDDCLPAPSWLSRLTAALADGAAVAQGRTVPEPGGWAGPWGRSLEVTRPTGLFETANLAARRDAILAVGGFRAERLLSGRAFGEDVELGTAVARTGGFAFAEDAVVYHRVMPASYRDFIEERKRLAGFPLLLRRVPELRRQVFLGMFLSRRTAITDLALGIGVVGQVVVLLLTFSSWVTVTDLAFVPWFAVLVSEARSRPGRNRLIRAAQLGVADLAGAAALLSGSLRARRVVL